MKHGMKTGLLLLTLLLPGLTLAQGPMGPGRGKPEPPFMRALFPPEMVMQNQGQIGLTEEQRTAITSAIQELQGRVVEIQWRMQEDQQQLGETLAAAQIDAEAALALADRVMETEKQIKKLHLGLLIRIKNELTPSQQAQLSQLRRDR